MQPFDIPASDLSPLGREHTINYACTFDPKTGAKTYSTGAFFNRRIYLQDPSDPTKAVATGLLVPSAEGVVVEHLVGNVTTVESLQLFMQRYHGMWTRRNQMIVVDGFGTMADILKVSNTPLQLHVGRGCTHTTCLICQTASLSCSAN